MVLNRLTPTDDSDDYLWIKQHSNINLFKDDIDTKESEFEAKNEHSDIKTKIKNDSMIDMINISDFGYNLNENRKSIILLCDFVAIGMHNVDCTWWTEYQIYQ